jgi:DNA-binding XRE family transcriptional regulator
MSNLKAALEALKNTNITGTPTQATQSPPTQQQAYVNPIQASRDMLKNKIKQERLAKGWTQRDLARESGMSQTTINRVERYGWTSIDTIMRVAIALGKNITIT